MDSDLRKKFAQALRATPNSDKKGIFYGGKAYSPKSLAAEVENDTPVGREHCRMLEELAAHTREPVERLIDQMSRGPSLKP